MGNWKSPDSTPGDRDKDRGKSKDFAYTKNQRVTGRVTGPKVTSNPNNQAELIKKANPKVTVGS